MRIREDSKMKYDEVMRRLYEFYRTLKTKQCRVVEIKITTTRKKIK